MVERNIHPLTGKLLADKDARGVRENFVADRLPGAESPDDYNAEGSVKFGSEYAEWLASAENSLNRQTMIAEAASQLRITSPLPGGTYLMDPDMPSSRRIPLVANGGAQLVWTSESFRCEADAGRDFAIGDGGRASHHRHGCLVRKDDRSADHRALAVTARPRAEHESTRCG